MILTDKQKAITSDIEYWKWFAAWWQEDFSWGKLRIRSYSYGGDLGDFTLQEYWVEEENHLIEFAGRKWTRFHLPEHDLEGSPSPKLCRSEQEYNAIGDLSGFLWPYNEQVELFRDLISLIKNKSANGQPIILSGVWLTFEYQYTNKLEQNRLAELENQTFGISADWTHNIGRINFRNVSFTDGAVFSHSFIYFFEMGFGEGSSIVHFGSSIFKDNAVLWHTKYDDASFLGTKFYGRVNFVGSTFNGFSNFTACQFHSYTDFAECTFNDRTSFTETIFKGLFVFRKAKLDPYVTFSTALFEQNKVNTKEDYETSFKWLQYALTDIQLYDEANMFARRARIIRASRKSLKEIVKSRWDRIFGRKEKTKYFENDSLSDGEVVLSKLYEFFAKSGQSIFLPLQWLLIFMMISTLAQYLVLIPNVDLCFARSSDCSVSFDALKEAINRSSLFSFPPISTISHNSIVQGNELKVNFVSNFISGILIALHGIFSSVFVFLSLLAIRRRLQLK